MRVVSIEMTETAALFWFADLRDRNPIGWKKVTWSVRSVLRGLTGHAPDIADLVIIRLDTREIIYTRPACDVTEAGQMLVTAKRELSEMTRQQFATEWSFTPPTA